MFARQLELAADDLAVIVHDRGPTRTAWRWFGLIRRSVACTTATPSLGTPRCW
ncbi:MAG: hypothetical protein ACLT5P_17240 [Flavonifractor plautii]